MVPIEQQMAAEVAARLARCGRTIVGPQDIDQAKATVFLRHNYQLIQDISLKERGYLGPHPPKKCRYCLGTRPQVRFKNTAHTLPECLGNKTLVSNDECDSCNQRFSESFEIHLDHMTLPIRSFLGIVGKNGPPEYVTKSGKSHLRFDPAGRNVLLMEQEGALLVSRDEVKKRLRYFFPCKPFVPLEIYRSLVKIGFAALPASELSYFEAARRWLLPKQPSTAWEYCALAECTFSFSTVPTESPVLRIWKRRRGAPPCPYLMVGFSLTHFSFMFAMPPGPMDRWEVGDNVYLPWFDLSEDPSKTACFWNGYKVRTTDLELEGGFTINLGYEEVGTFSNEEFEAISGWKLDRKPD